MFEAFAHHPTSVNEAYFEHLCMAMGFAANLFLATLVCSVHSLLPLLFVKTGSALITKLHDRMVCYRIKSTNATDPDGSDALPIKFMI